jgi:hypothetical protein
VRRPFAKKLTIRAQVAALIYPAGAIHEGILHGRSGRSEISAEQLLTTATWRHIKAFVHQLLEDFAGTKQISSSYDYLLRLTVAVIKINDDNDLRIHG